MDTCLCVCVCVHVCVCLLNTRTCVLFLSDFAYETMKVRGLVMVSCRVEKQDRRARGKKRYRNTVS